MKTLKIKHWLSTFFDKSIGSGVDKIINGTPYKTPAAKLGHADALKVILAIEKGKITVESGDTSEMIADKFFAHIVGSEGIGKSHVLLDA